MFHQSYLPWQMNHPCWKLMHTYPSQSLLVHLFWTKGNLPTIIAERHQYRKISNFKHNVYYHVHTIWHFTMQTLQISTESSVLAPARGIWLINGWWVGWIVVGTHKNLPLGGACKHCECPLFFKWTPRGIGFSFQLAITTPRMNLIGYGTATAQSWSRWIPVDLSV